MLYHKGLALILHQGLRVVLARAIVFSLNVHQGYIYSQLVSTQVAVVDWRIAANPRALFWTIASAPTAPQKPLGLFGPEQSIGDGIISRKEQDLPVMSCPSAQLQLHIANRSQTRLRSLLCRPSFYERALAYQDLGGGTIPRIDVEEYLPRLIHV
ncbi:hypothetical protein BC835DRAFT_322033 [Cytidiella melzeri]|nr:hypothetical protein BC835DRAFT_322033 [Cytidiella melzeri]